MAGIVPVPPALQTLTLTAGGAISAYRFVGFDSLVCGANATAVGVSPDYDVASGEVFPCVTQGIVIVQASAAISVGAAVASTSTGKAVTATSLSATVPGSGTTVTSSSAQPAMTIAGSVTPQKINGYALDAAGADGDYIRVKLA